MVIAVSTGVGAVWLGLSLFLLAVVTFVILTGDSIEHLSTSSPEEESAASAAGTRADEQVKEEDLKTSR